MSVLKVNNKYLQYFSLLNYKEVFETTSSDVAGNLQRYAYEFEKITGILPLVASYIRRKRLFIIIKHPYIRFELVQKYKKKSLIKIVDSY